nr:immunoglobulin heavy chain junction region [Macaca mulatta]
CTKLPSLAVVANYNRFDVW